MKNLFFLLFATIVIVTCVFAFGMSPKTLLTSGLFALPLLGMAMGATTGISKSVKCTAPIATAYTIAKSGLDDDTYSVAAGSADPLVGIFQSVTTNIGDYVEVMVTGISKLKLGGTVTRGNPLTSDAYGQGIAASALAGAGTNIIGTALASGVSGDIIPVRLLPVQYLKLPLRTEVALADASATLTAAQMISNGIFKITPTATRTLTTDTAAAIVAAITGCVAQTAFDFVLTNLGTSYAILAGGAGVTLVGNTATKNSASAFRAVITNATVGSEAVTLYALAGDAAAVDAMAISPITALADASATLTAAQMINGVFTLTPTAGRALTTDTAANLVAAMPQAVVNGYFVFSIACLAAFAATLTAGAGITLTGNAAVNNASGMFRGVFTNVTPGSEAVTIVRMA